MGLPEPEEVSGQKRRRFLPHRNGGLTDQNPEQFSEPLPPSPKRRHVEDFQEEQQPGHSPLQPSSQSSFTQSRPLDKPEDEASSRSTVPPSVAGPSRPSLTAPSFDRATFEAFVGTRVDDDVLEVIRNNCGDSMERAVNMYFDGALRALQKMPTTLRSATTSHHSTNVLRQSRSTPSHSESSTRRPQARPIPESRYLGAFGVAGWCTRSGANLLNSGDVIKIERQKAQPLGSLSKGKPKTGVIAAPRGPSSKRADVVVRFTDSSGAEIGRLEKEAANWVSTLIDQNVCKFEGTCVWAPDILRTNDTVYLQLRCAMRSSAFNARAFQDDKSQSKSIFEALETSEERDLRLRQVALVRLFQEINLFPTKASAAFAKHGRQGLLDAAEMAEEKENQALKLASR